MSKVNVPIAFLSLVTSVLLWASVYNNANGKYDQKTLTVGIIPTNLDSTKYIASEIPDTMTLGFTGFPDQLRNALPQTKAFVDLSAATPGVKAYPIVVFPISAREMLVNNAITARIKIEALVSKSFDVKATLTGALPEGKRVESIDVFPKRIFVTGTQDTVQKIVGIQVSVDYSTEIISTEGTEVTAKAVDASGVEVPRVILTITDSHPEFTPEIIKIPTTIRVRMKLEQEPVTPTMPLKFP